MYGVQLWWNYKKSTLNRLHIAYHNILKLFIDMSKYESTSLQCTLFDVQCSQSVIRNMVYRFICRLDSFVICILNDILTSTLRFTSGIRKHWNKLIYIYEHLTKTNVYILLIYTALGQNAYCTYCLPNVNIWTSESHVLAVCALLSLEYSYWIELNWRTTVGPAARWRHVDSANSTSFSRHTKKSVARYA